MLGSVGIEAVLDQLRIKAMKTGFEFNIMVVGELGQSHRGNDEDHSTGEHSDLPATGTAPSTVLNSDPPATGTAPPLSWTQSSTLNYQLTEELKLNI